MLLALVVAEVVGIDTADQAYSSKYNVKVHRLISSTKFRIADAALVNVFYEKCGVDKEI